MNNDNKNGLWALLLTLLLTGTAVLILVSSYLTYTPVSNENLAQLKQDSILFGGEYVMLGDISDAEGTEPAAEPQQNADEQSDVQDAPEGDDMDNAGEPVKQPAPVVTATKESPMKVKEKPKEDKNKQVGPAVKTTKQTDKPQVKQGVNTATNSRVKNAFGTGGAGTGAQGSPNGNSNQGVTLGKPGLDGLVGYSIESWARPNPNSKWSGYVQVRVRVNTRGKVVEAHAVGSSGEISGHPEMRRACEQAALKSSFSVPLNTTTEGVGTITYKWK